VTPQSPNSQAGPSPGYYPPGPPAYDPIPPIYAPLKKQRWVWLLVAAVILFWCLIILGVLALLRATAGPQSATRGYISAVQAHNWNAAYGYLDTSLRTTVQPADIEALWLQREKVDGPINHFTVCCGGVITHFGSADTGNASVVLTYNNGTSGTMFSMLVKEGDGWKLSRLL
jgi:hypothetical protein